MAVISMTVYKMAGKKMSYRHFFVSLFVLFVVLFSVQIKQEPPETESITENGQSKEEDDTKEAGELVSKDLMIQLKTNVYIYIAKDLQL